MSGPRVDIVLPTHARPATLACAIRSVQMQTVGDWRLHVVGDGAGPETEQVVREAKERRAAYHGLPKARGFGYANRNVVLRATTAPIVAYMSDDDLWFPDHLERTLAALDSQRLDLVATGTLVVRPPGRVDPFFFAYSWRAPGLRALQHWFLGAANVVHRRAVLERVGYWSEELLRFGDREFYNRARASALRTGLLPERTLLRFFAAHWDPLYARLAAPPQQDWLTALAEPARVRDLRAAGEVRAPAPARARQAADFAAFAWRTGPRFLRFLAARARTA